MPLYKTINHNENTKVLIWKIEEDLDFLSDVILTSKSKLRVYGMRSESHKKGFLAVRKLLEEIGLSDNDLYYNENGKPLLNNGKNISISHSFDFSSIAISDSEIGIDIEKNRDKIKKIASKFIDKENDYLTEENLVEKLTVIWGSKESLFKIYPDGELLFKQHLPIDAFKLSDKKLKGHILKGDFNKSFSIYFDSFDGYTLTFATNEKKVNE